MKPPGSNEREIPTAAKHTQSSHRPILLWFLVVVGFLWMGITMCICGHASWDTAAGILPLFCFASYVFVVFPHRGRLEQILGAIAFALLLAMFVKTIGDILYFGHNPILR